MHGSDTRPIIADTPPPYHYPFLRQGHSLSFPKVIALPPPRSFHPPHQGYFLSSLRLLHSPSPKSLPTPPLRPLYPEALTGLKTTHGRSSKKPTVGRDDDLQWVASATYHRSLLGYPWRGQKARKKGVLESGRSDTILPLCFRKVSPSSSPKANHLKIPAFLVVLLTIVRSFIKTKTLHATIRSLDSIPRTYPDLCRLP